MNPSPRLAKVHSAATKRIRRLRVLVDGLSLPSTTPEDRLVAWVVIEMVNLWANFLRSYYLSCSIETRTGSGVTLTFTSVTFIDVQAALRHSVVLLRDPKFSKPVVSRRDEPAWHDSRKFLILAKNVGISNLTHVYRAFGYKTAFFEFLIPVRNFYAHRCDETHRKASNVGVKMGLAATPRLRATEIMCAALPHRPHNLITDWLDDMRNVIDLLCA